MDKNKYSMVVKALDFGKRSKSRNKFVDRESFLKVITSNQFKEALEDGRLLGELTHKDRFEDSVSMIPYEDRVMLSPYLCNVLKAVEVDGDTVLMGIDLLDNETGNKVKDLIKKGVKLSVSISTLARQDNVKFYVTDIKGIDFTLKPDLDAEIISTNFSEDSSDGVTNILCLSEEPTEFNEFINFSLKDYLREMNKPPYLVLKNRIMEVIRYCKFKSEKKLLTESKYIRSYIDGYIYQYILDMLNSNTNQNMNIVLGLRLSPYMTNRSVATRLQQTFKRIKSSLTSTGIIPRELQKKLNSDFNELMKQIYSYINTKCKKNIL